MGTLERTRIGRRHNECPKELIVHRLLELLTGSGGIENEWPRLARKLGICDPVITCWTSQLNTHKINSTYELLHKILDEWKSSCSSDATLEQFLLHLESLKWQSIADDIKQDWKDEKQQRQSNPSVISPSIIFNFLWTSVLADNIVLRYILVCIVCVLLSAVIIIVLVVIIIFPILNKYNENISCDRSIYYRNNNLEVSAWSEYLEAKERSSLCVTHLTLASLNESSWDHNFRIIDADLFISLKIVGFVTPDMLINVLSQTHSLTELHIINCYSKDSTNNLSHKSLNPLIHGLPFLKNIVLNNYTLCAQAISHIFSHTHQDRTCNLSLINGYITQQDVESVNQITQTFKCESIVFEGYISGLTDMVLWLNKFSHVKYISLNLWQLGKLSEAKIYFDKHLCTKFPNVETLHTVEMPYLDFLRVLMNCKKLNRLDVGIVIKDSSKYYDLNAANRNRPFEPNTIIHFIFETKCPEMEDISAIGLNEFQNTVCKSCLLDAISTAKGLKCSLYIQ